MNRIRISFILIVLLAGLSGAVVVNLFHTSPQDRFIHIRSFRYGKDPDIIRCNRGDRLHLTFSTDDTGHSFFLSEFNIDVKISPGTRDVAVFKADRPEDKPEIRRDVIITAEHQGILNYLVSKSTYRCHVWCGLLHGFEQGSLIIFPNTLLGFGMGSLAGVLLLLFLPGVIIWEKKVELSSGQKVRYSKKWTDLFRRSSIRLIFTFLCVIFIYLIIIISILGTRVAGRNLGTIMVWFVWLFLLVTIMTPFFGRIWCYICPIPFFGDFIQRGTISSVISGKTGKYNNRFFGLNLKWPEKLNNSWFMLATFLILGTFSTTIVSVPRISGLLILTLVLGATILAVVFELRAFCRYICPINAYISHYSRIGMLSLRAVDKKICSGKCKAKFCETGNAYGWACPYGLNCETIEDNSKCGLCMECLNSCSFSNTSLGFKKFGVSPANLSLSESFTGIALLVIGIVYNLLYHGPWAELREYINIVDKNNWDLFLYYSLLLWVSALVIFPTVFYTIAHITRKIKKIDELTTKQLFSNIVNAIIPLGMMIWVAFIIPMVLNNFTFILQSLSDPFGWGWNWFGFAGIPWKPLIPEAVPWIQVLLIIAGVLMSIVNLSGNLNSLLPGTRSVGSIRIIGTFFLFIGAGMILFYAHF